MKNNRLKLSLLLLGLCLVIGGCSKTDDTPALDPSAPPVGIDFEALANDVSVTETAVTFTDAMNREVTIPKNPQRVISLVNSYTALWYQADGTIIARIENESELPAEALDPSIQTVGATAATVSVEAMLALEPDLVILRASTGSDYLGQLEQNGVPVIAMEYNGFADYLKWLKIFTALTGNEELYTTQGTDLMSEINSIIARVPNDNNPTVMLMFGTTKSVKAYLSNTAVGEMLSQMKAVNIADTWEDTTATSVDMNIEYLITADPDYILVQCMGNPDDIKAYIDSTYGAENWWNALKAVQEDRVVYLNRSLFHFKPSGRYAEAYLELGKIIYPDVFA